MEAAAGALAIIDSAEVVVGLSALVSGAIAFFKKKGRQWWFGVKRWWGGAARERLVWDAYKTGRSKIMQQTTDPGTRLFLLQDWRSECRMTYPEYESIWN